MAPGLRLLMLVLVLQKARAGKSRVAKFRDAVRAQMASVAMSTSMSITLKLDHKDTSAHPRHDYYGLVLEIAATYRDTSHLAAPYMTLLRLVLLLRNQVPQR
jgi:hypothetical protein